jgi:hypothetical protein
MIPRVKPEDMLFGEPVSTPDYVRGGLFPDHALGSVVERKAAAGTRPPPAIRIVPPLFRFASRRCDAELRIARIGRRT